MLNTHARAALAIIIIGLPVAILAARAINTQPMQPLSKLEAQVVKPDTKIKTTSQTLLVQKILYQQCGDEEVVKIKMPDNLIGLARDDFQKIYLGWSINRFDAQETNLSLSVDSFCRDHANNIFVGIKDEFVAIYYGKPQQKPILKEVTQIPLSSVNNRNFEELSKGVIINNREELLQVLEGLQSN